jgi:hypothetical protein
VEKTVEEVKEEKQETYIDVMNRLNLNDNAKAIIREKIEELHREIDEIINNRQKMLDSKLKEIEDSLKVKKK